MRIFLSFLLCFIFVGSLVGQNQNSLLRIKENGKWGLYNFLQSKVVAEPKYDRIGQRSPWGIKTMLDDKVGMVSNRGELISEPRFKDIYGYSTKIYKITLLDGSINVLDIATGEIILPVGDYDKITPINETYFIIQKDGLNRVMTKYGNYTTKKSYSILRSNTYLEEHVIAEIGNGKKGVVRIQDGATIIPHQYLFILPINKTYSKFQIDSTHWGVMNHLNHQVIIEDEYTSVKPLGKEYFILEDQNSQQYLFDIKKNETIELKQNYNSFNLIHENYILVRRNGLYGIINLKGDTVLPLNYNTIHHISSSGNRNLVTIQKNGLEGIYDLKNNKELLAIQYKSIRQTDDQFIFVHSHNGQGLYNKYFEKLLDPKYQKIQIKNNSIKARQGKGVEIYWLDSNQRITETENYNEFYTLRIGYKKSAIINNESPGQKNKIIFPDVKFEWVRERGNDKKAYKPIDSDSIWSNYDYIPNDKTGTHFSTVKTKGITANRNDFIKGLSSETYSFKPFRLFDGNKGLFLPSDYMFTGFRFSDFSKDGLDYMAVILKNGSFRMMSQDGTWLMDENNQPLDASYIEEMNNGMIKYAIGGEWVVEKDSLVNINPAFIIDAKKTFGSFGINHHYEYKYWAKHAYLENAKWGFLDSTYQVVIPAQYEDVSNFRHGKAIISKDGQIGCIDKKNKLITPAEYHDIYITAQGGMILEKENKEKNSYLIDKNGVQLLKENYSFSDQLIEGARRVKRGNQYGFVDQTGKLIIPIEYDSLGNFNEGYALAVKDSHYFIIDKNGKELLKNKSFKIKGTVSHDLIRVEKNNKYGFVNINGDIIIPIKYGLAFDFQKEGLARVVVGRKTGLIDHTGTFVLEPNLYELIFPFDENGLAIVQHVQYGIKGLINTTGTAIVKPYYQEIEPFHGGYAIVKKDNKYGYINLMGEEVIPATHYKAYRASQGTMAVREAMQDLWIFKDSSNQRINNLEFTKPAIYKDGHSIITVVTDTQSYHRCLVNLKGDTLFFSDKKDQVYFYSDGIVGIKRSTPFIQGNVRVSHHFKFLNETRFRGQRAGYRNLSPFFGQVAIVRPQINMGLMDIHSNYITTLKYKQILRNKDNSYTAVPDRFYGYADKDGNIILEPIYDYLSSIIRNNRHILHVEKGDQIGYMDVQGNWIWDMER